MQSEERYRRISPRGDDGGRAAIAPKERLPRSPDETCDRGKHRRARALELELSTSRDDVGCKDLIAQQPSVTAARERELSTSRDDVGCKDLAAQQLSVSPPRASLSSRRSATATRAAASTASASRRRRPTRRSPRRASDRDRAASDDGAALRRIATPNRLSSHRQRRVTAPDETLRHRENAPLRRPVATRQGTRARRRARAARDVRDRARGAARGVGCRAGAGERARAAARRPHEVRRVWAHSAWDSRLVRSSSSVVVVECSREFNRARNAHTSGGRMTAFQQSPRRCVTSTRPLIEDRARRSAPPHPRHP